MTPAVIAQIFIHTTELLTPTGTQANEANAEIETQQLLKLKQESVQHSLNTYMSFYIFHSLNHYVLFHIFYESNTVKSIHYRIIFLYSKHVAIDLSLILLNTY